MANQPPYAVILVPPGGDPLGMLQEGPCGGRPPTVVWTVEGRWVPSPQAGPGQRAVVLAWEGQVLQDGLMYVARAEARAAGHGGMAWPHAPSVHEVLRVARAWERAGIGNVVLLDASEVLHG